MLLCFISKQANMFSYPSFIILYALTFATFVCCTLTTPSSTSSEDSSRQMDQYTTEIINNDKIRDVYIKCMLDKGPCNNDAADIKKMVPEAVQRGCAKCSEMHKKIIEKMMLHLKEKQPEILQQVTAKFDPKGEFMKTFLMKLQQGVMNKSNESGQHGGPLSQPGHMPKKGGTMSQSAPTQYSKPIPN